MLGANDTVRIAVAGINGRGSEHIKHACQARKTKNVEIAYLVDPDSRLFPMRSETGQATCGNTPKCVQDLRKALDDKNLDAVSIATPNHWHSLLAIWACQAGKDVYVEKPCSHNICRGPQARRGRAEVRPHRAARHAEPLRSEIGRRGGGRPQRQVRQAADRLRLCQQAAAEHRLQAAEGAARRSSISTSGSARRRSSRITRTWCITTGTGSGTSATARSATRASHQMDIARWAMPEGAAPQSVVSLGGRFG